MTNFQTGDLIKQPNDPYSYLVLTITYSDFNQYGIIQRINDGQIFSKANLVKFIKVYTISTLPKNIIFAHDKQKNSLLNQINISDKDYVVTDIGERVMQPHRQAGYLIDKFINYKEGDIIDAYAIKKVMVKSTQTKHIDGEDWSREVKISTYVPYRIKISNINFTKYGSALGFFSVPNTKFNTDQLNFFFAKDSIFSIFASKKSAEHFIESKPDWSKVQLMDYFTEEYKGE